MQNRKGCRAEQIQDNNGHIEYIQKIKLAANRSCN